MLCLKCDLENTHTGPHCRSCGNWLGLSYDGRGFIPQVQYLDLELDQGKLSPAECELRLQRLVRNLQAQLQTIQQRSSTLSTLGLHPSQEAVISGYIAPWRQGLERLVRLFQQLDVAAPWGQSFWNELEKAQGEVVRGQGGITYLNHYLSNMSRIAA